ncbi:hypothetical protein PTKIN_Ptkin02bG0186800 [Pterospermum kingtungense]
MFSKVLTESDLEKSLVIPTTCSFNVLPFEDGHFFYMNVVDDTGNAWTFPCFLQQISDDDNDHQTIGNSSAISIGWLTFARKQDIRVGDTVFLDRKSLDNDNFTGTTQFRIEMKRKIRLLGHDIWAAMGMTNSATNNYI